MTLSFKRLALGLGVVIALCYAGSLTGGFHFDDSHSVESNLAVRSMANIPSFWTDATTSSFIPENRVYRPLVYTFYSICWTIGGGQTWPFHVMKIFMHWGVALALMLIWARLWSEPGWFPLKNLNIRFPFFKAPIAVTPLVAAFLLALLFGIHPAGSECVDYVSATTSLQCALFYVWAYYAYLLYRDSRDPRKLALSLGLYFLSVASKEEGITLPAMIFLTEFFLARPAAKKRPGAESAWSAFAQRVWVNFKFSVPYVAMGLALAAWIVLMRPASGDESRGYHSSLSYFLTQWRAYLWYMRLWFWPWDLNADNASIEFSKSLTDPLVIQAAIGNLLVLVISWMNRRKYPALLFGVVWFYVTIAPASSVVVLAEAINEHRMYLAYVGFAGGTFTVLLAMSEALFAEQTRAVRLAWIFLAVAVGLFTGTQERNRVWRNGQNLWTDTVEKNPTSGRALNNLALVYMARAEYDRALPLLDKCAQHWPTYMYCALNKGLVLASQADIADKAGNKAESTRLAALSEASLLRAYELNPRNVHVNYHLGKLHQMRKKDYEKAAFHFKTAIDLTAGRYPAAEADLANCYAKMGKAVEAKAAFERALQLDSNPEGMLFEKARGTLDAGDPAGAAETYRKLLERNPRHLQAWYNLGVTYLALKQVGEARAAFERTVALDPRSEQGWYNLAVTADTLGDGPTAISAVRELARLQPGKPKYGTRLQELLRKYGGTPQ
ncbi:MAG: tetratricopeptide repeat protein [Oligoflexia bacterium]|nr:tetratricopeptide repeat protein [Oligoflexia bacterium]